MLSFEIMVVFNSLVFKDNSMKKSILMELTVKFEQVDDRNKLTKGFCNRARS